jgi:protein O-GlcNAc transferase
MQPASRTSRAEALLHEGQTEQARALLQRILQQSPRDVEANRLMSIALNLSGDLERALFFAERASAARPGDAGLMTAVGNLLFNLGRTDEAMEAFSRAAKVEPGHAEAWEAIADLHFQHARFADAEAACREGLMHRPGHPVLSTTLAAVLLNSGRGGESFEILRASAAERPLDQVIAAACAQASLYVDGVEPEEILRLHRRFAGVMDRLLPDRLNVRPRSSDAEGPLRVGLVSADFRRHSVAYFLEPLLENLDRERFRLVFYHTVLNEDDVTARFRALATAWRNVATVPVQDLAALIAKDSMDILIDLGGHTDASRLAAFHMRPAPVQVSYLGYASTTGLPEMDYRIVDSVTDPMTGSHGSGADAYSTERLVRLDPCFLCYRPAPEAMEVVKGRSGAARRAGSGGVTFGSFNVLQKVTDQLLALWARVIGSVPGSRLVLKTQGFNQQAIQELMAERLVRAGVAAGRFELLPWIPSVRGHFEAYEGIDVALDTHPYNGTTTTCDALVMGVPVVTLAGKHHASRVGASILTAVGLEECIADSPDAYVAIASRLAGDLSRLDRWRRELPERALASALCDGPAYARRFERALRDMWQSRVVGKS